MVEVLFVCMGNICRSPTAEGVFRQLVHQRNLTARISIDSAGTIAFHEGEPPDPRAQETALKNGIDLSAIRARQVTPVDFERFHYILAMDHENLDNMRAIAPTPDLDNVYLFCEFAQNHDVDEVPDPYYGGPKGFDTVFRLVQDASEGLLRTIVDEHALG